MLLDLANQIIYTEIAKTFILTGGVSDVASGGGQKINSISKNGGDNMKRVSALILALMFLFLAS